MYKYREHWYKIIIDDCPVCGGTSYRERVYGKKPDNLADRYEYLTPIYCGCLGDL